MNLWYYIALGLVGVFLVGALVLLLIAALGSKNAKQADIEKKSRALPSREKKNTSEIASSETLETSATELSENSSKRPDFSGDVYVPDNTKGKTPTAVMDSGSKTDWLTATPSTRRRRRTSVQVEPEPVVYDEQEPVLEPALTVEPEYITEPEFVPVSEVETTTAITEVDVITESNDTTAVELEESQPEPEIAPEPEVIKPTPPVSLPRRNLPRKNVPSVVEKIAEDKDNFSWD